MSLRIRVDDFPCTKPAEEWKHNLKSFKSFNKVMKDFNLNYVLGVIPVYTKPKDLRWLSYQDNITIAMHGTIHNEDTLDEFQGTEYQNIWRPVQQAKVFLEAHSGQKIVDYIPPHNTISLATTVVLSDMQFENVYGGPETSEKSKEQIKSFGMNYIHSYPPLEYGRSDELLEQGSVEYLTEKCKEEEVWLTLHSPWEVNIGLEHLHNFMSKLKENEVI